jgi:hypothetical protein
VALGQRHLDADHRSGMADLSPHELAVDAGLSLGGPVRAGARRRADRGRADGSTPTAPARARDPVGLPRPGQPAGDAYADRCHQGVARPDARSLSGYRRHAGFPGTPDPSGGHRRRRGPAERRLVELLSVQRGANGRAGAGRGAGGGLGRGGVLRGQRRQLPSGSGGVADDSDPGVAPTGEGLAAGRVGRGATDRFA